MEWSDGKFSIKGDSSEMVNFFKETNADVDALLPKQELSIKKKWLIISSFLFIALACATWCLYDNNSVLSGILSIILFAMIAVTAIICHLSLKNKTATIIACFFALVIYMVAIHVFTPEEAGKELKGKVDNVINNDLQNKGK